MAGVTIEIVSNGPLAKKSSEARSGNAWIIQVERPDNLLQHTAEGQRPAGHVGFLCHQIFGGGHAHFDRRGRPFSLCYHQRATAAIVTSAQPAARALLPPHSEPAP